MSRSTTRQRVRFRCRRCRVRFAWRIARRADPKCPACSSRDVRNIEAERLRELGRQQRCQCLAYPFPHRAGSLRMCLLHPLADVEPTDIEVYEYEACMRTPRSTSC